MGEGMVKGASAHFKRRVAARCQEHVAIQVGTCQYVS